MRCLTLMLVSAIFAFPAFAQSAQKSDPNWNAYMDRMKVMMKRNWFPPKSTKKSHIVVGFGVDASGQVHDLRVLTSSGDAVKDVTAMDAVKKTAPLEALPKNGPPCIDVEFSFDFDPKLGAKQQATFKAATEPESKH